MDTQSIILDQSNPDMHLKNLLVCHNLFHVCEDITQQNEESNLLNGHQG